MQVLLERTGRTNGDHLGSTVVRVKAQTYGVRVLKGIEVLRSSTVSTTRHHFPLVLLVSFFSEYDPQVSLATPTGLGL